MATNRLITALLTTALVTTACGGGTELASSDPDPEPTSPASSPAEEPEEVAYHDALGEALKPLGDLFRNQEQVILGLARGTDQASRATAVEDVQAAATAFAQVEAADGAADVHAAVEQFLDEAVAIAGRLDQAARDGDVSAGGAAEIDLALAADPVFAAATDDADVCAVVARSVGKAKHTRSYCPDAVPHGQWGQQVHALTRAFALGTTTAQQQRLMDLWQDGDAFRAYLLQTEPHVQPANDRLVSGLQALDTPDEVADLRDALIAFVENNAQVGRDLMAHAEAGDSPDTMVEETLMPAGEAYGALVEQFEDGECVLFVELEC